MQKKFAFSLISFAFLIGLFSSYSFNETIGVAKQPDYEKWGRIAINVVKESYVNEQVSDYKYEGRKSISDTKAEDTFTFTIKRNNNEFTVKAVVAFNPESDTLQSIALVEETQ